jgi:hypothetical protein
MFLSIPRNAGAVFAATGGLALLHLGCTGKPAPAPAPVLTSFHAAAGSVVLGASTTLTAVFRNGTGAVSGGVGPVQSGVPVTVTPQTTTTYTLTVTNAAGVKALETQTVTVLTAADFKEDISPLEGITVVAPHASPWTNPAGIRETASEPTSHASGDNGRSFGNWPWVAQDSVEYQFEAPALIARSAVYWWCDGDETATPAGNEGGVGAPSSYRVQFWNLKTSAWTDVVNARREILQDGAWTADPAHPATTVTYDAYDGVAFNPVTTTGLRLLMEPRVQPGDYEHSLGIQRWKVYGRPNQVVDPVIISFTATIPSLSAGQLTQLIPVFRFGTGSIDHGVGTVTSGQAVNVTPTANTTYTLTVTNLDGKAVTATTALTLVPLTGAAYAWPAYSPNLDYNFKNEYGTMAAPTQVLDDAPAVVGTAILGASQLPEGVAAPWWCFRYGPDRNPLVTEAAWVPMLQRYEKDFSYFRDVMGWPPDKRAKRGYYSTVYLFGSGLADGASNTELGGWQSANDWNGESWPMVMLSYFPVQSFDPAATNADKTGQQGACIHEGIHSILADMDGCKQAAWFQEGGNTSLQGATEAYKASLAGDPTAYASIGWLSQGSMIAPFMPIESYSGWLQDGTFGGPAAEGVNVNNADGVKLCTWRQLLGGVQYSEAFAHFMTECVSPGSTAWIWKYCTGRVLEGLATGRHETVGATTYAVDGLGDTQIRRLILEFRSRAATCDFGKWSGAYRKLLQDAWGQSVGSEGVQDGMPDLVQNLPVWKAYPYAQTTSDGAAQPTLTPDPLTLPGWSGANEVPLTVASGAASVMVNFKPLGAGLRCQLVYLAADGTTVYSQPVAGGPCMLKLDKAPRDGVVIAVIVNTDYVYAGEATRTAKYDYRLQLVSGFSGAAEPTQPHF